MNDSLSKTILVAAGVCLFCSIFVSSAAVILKPIQQKNEDLDKKKNILVAAGLLHPKEYAPAAKIDALFDESIKPIVVDLASGEVRTDVDFRKVDEDKAIKSPEESSNIDTKADIAKIRKRANLSVIYERVEGGKVQSVVFPIYGKGLWSTMYGFISLDPGDYSTVLGINFYKHGETAGLGGEIENPKWQSLWHDKKVYSEDGKSTVIEVVRNGMVDAGNPEKAIHEVDGIAGSTLTSVGVSHTVRYWLGENGFGKYIDKMREKETGK